MLDPGTKMICMKNSVMARTTPACSGHENHFSTQTLGSTQQRKAPASRICKTSHFAGVSIMLLAQELPPFLKHCGEPAATAGTFVWYSHRVD